MGCGGTCSTCRATGAKDCGAIDDLPRAREVEFRPGFLWAGFAATEKPRATGALLTIVRDWASLASEWKVDCGKFTGWSYEDRVAFVREQMAYVSPERSGSFDAAAASVAVGLYKWCNREQVDPPMAYEPIARWARSVELVFQSAPDAIQTYGGTSYADPQDYAGKATGRRLRATGGPGPAQSGTSTTSAQLQWSSNVASVIGSVANSTLAVVQGALAADVAARRLEAEQAAARLAAAASDAERASVAVGAAEGAYQKARTASAMLAGGDRAGATTRLSEGQGMLAAAVAARAYFEQMVRRMPPSLATAIDRARAEIDRVVTAIESSAVPPAQPTADNPVAANERGPCTPSPMVYGGGAVAGAVAGFLVAGPIGAVIGAVVGGGGGYLYEQQQCATR